MNFGLGDSFGLKKTCIKKHLFMILKHVYMIFRPTKTHHLLIQELSADCNSDTLGLLRTCSFNLSSCSASVL